MRCGTISLDSPKVTTSYCEGVPLKDAPADARARAAILLWLLVILACSTIIGGLVVAFAEYRLAFSMGILDTYHLFRGLIWNVLAFSFAQMLFWVGYAAYRTVRLD